ncbi:potassium channel family protein [Streptomyces polyrhachis]|uniref:Potassium channel family protein n=1 Tax=Streptomyces polyrhachis TaxID=1282885 RepID=A0ABW2GIV3_9ACTN
MTTAVGPSTPERVPEPAPEPTGEVVKLATRVERWERAAYRPLLALAMLFAAAYALPIVVDDLPPDPTALCQAVEWLVWGAFAADYLIRLALAQERWRFVRRHWLDLLIVLLPLIQPLRLLRLVSAVLLTGRRVRAASQVRLTTYIGGSLLGLLCVGSLAVLEVEKGRPGANINSIGDAAWWAFTTMTTVGYGDHSPTTGLGRLIAVGLMISGIALIGLVTANIAAWFISRFEADTAQETRQLELLQSLSQEVAALRGQVGELTERLSGRESA